MKKKILSLALVALLAVGCNSAKEEAKDSKTEQKVVRLSKDDYMKKLEEKALEMQELQGQMTTSNAKEAVDKVNAKIDEMIDLNGPEKIADKEAKVDEALTKLKDILESAKTLKDTDTEKATKMMTDIQAIGADLTTAITEYNK